MIGAAKVPDQRSNTESPIGLYTGDYVKQSQFL